MHEGAIVAFLCRAATVRAMETYLTVKQTAKVCQVHPSTVNRWIRDGKLPAKKLGGTLWRVSRTDLGTFLERGSE